ncbi:hypothetical protein FA95DRAFT_637779 [Auriscalpium vulgare]|uniref:Uncharacterized protein n=1 Tax=Auriscalpium vulgare TaxID=40419 RepID=A0ACB8RCQ1_9AGAM|nr:hypothetical protein FA95DRAFT_637779 [Auriscalpium vulgare]
MYCLVYPNRRTFAEHRPPWVTVSERQIPKVLGSTCRRPVEVESSNLVVRYGARAAGASAREGCSALQTAVMKIHSPGKRVGGSSTSSLCSGPATTSTSCAHDGVGHCLFGAECPASMAVGKHTAQAGRSQAHKRRHRHQSSPAWRKTEPHTTQSIVRQLTSRGDAS